MNRTHVPTPPGYPASLETDVRLDDGLEVFIRPVVPADAATIAGAVQSADSESLYFRFFTPTPRLTQQKLHYLTTLDYDRRMAIAAFLPSGEGIAIARYEGDATSDIAEIAVAVKNGYRRHGLAAKLLVLLEAAAIDRGIRSFKALYLPENEAAAALVHRLGFSPPVVEDGIAEVTKPLTMA